MAYDNHLADRIKMMLKQKNITFNEKKMMGGVVFMVNDKMCVGVMKNQLMIRIDPETYKESLGKKGCRPMDFSGRPMKGWVLIEPDGIDMDEDLQHWIQLALDYNPKAKSYRK
jgi:TfoX/Sxy family transcriptional regulator of competence genes